MHDAIGRIMQLRDSLKERYHYDAFTVPYPTLNLGLSMAATPQTASALRAAYGYSPASGMTLNDLNGLLDEALAPVSERWPGRLTVPRAASADSGL